MKKRKFATLMTCAFLVIGSDMQCSWAENMPIIQEKQTYGDDFSDSAYAGGYVESELDNNTPVYDSGIAMYSNIPVTYPDNGLSGIKEKYPDSRNQNPYGTCWAFASIGLAEFDLINDCTANRNIDLSELQLVNFTFDSVTDPLGGTDGDYSKYYKENASSSILNYGGNFEYASRRLSQWYGAVDEKDVPYANAYAVGENGLDDKYAYDYDVAHLHDAYMISRIKNTDEVKLAIMEHGAVGAGYTHYADGENHINNSYYDYKGIPSGYGDGGHAVMIVGWDDNYSKDNFGTSIKPQNNGAWLVRNSWGSYFSYFWMSYETYSLTETAWVFDFDSNDGFDNNYQYDGGLETIVYPYYKTVANVFTVPEKEGMVSETLKAVSLSFMETADVGYKIEVYTDLTDLKNPMSGVKQENATTTGNTTFAGIYTITLDNPVELMPGSSYAVVLTTDKGAIDQEYAVSYADLSTNTPVWEHVVSGSNGRSLYYNGRNFGVWPNNYCIKAFTSNNTESSIEDDYKKVADAKSIVENTIENMVASNDLTQEALYLKINTELENSDMTSVNIKIENFSKSDADTITSGSISATIIISSGWANDMVILNKTISKLPVTPVGDDQNATGVLQGIDGNWYYFVNGQIDHDFNGVASNSNGSWALEGGRVNFNYNGFKESNGLKYYFEKSLLKSSVTSVINYGKDWYYIQKGILYHDNVPTIAQNSNGWWYIGTNGKVDFKANTVTKNSNGWWYTSNGKVDFNYNGIASNSNGTWAIENGRVNFNYNGFKESNGLKYYFEKSKFMSEITSVVNYGKDWYYIQKGILYNEKKPTIAQNVNGWWYIGTDGKVDFNANTVTQNSNGWWYTSNGKVDFNYNGIASNSNGTWAIENGRVNFNYNGLKEANGLKYYFEKSQLKSGITSVINCGREWYYVQNGIVYHGDAPTIAQNSNGWWYIGIDGKVDFQYSGSVKAQDGNIYIVKSGKVQK